MIPNFLSRGLYYSDLAHRVVAASVLSTYTTSLWRTTAGTYLSAASMTIIWWSPLWGDHSFTSSEYSTNISTNCVRSMHLQKLLPPVRHFHDGDCRIVNKAIMAGLSTDRHSPIVSLASTTNTDEFTQVKLWARYRMRTHFVTMILTHTKLGTFSKAIWTKRNQKLHDPTKTPSRQHPISMRILPTTMPTLKIFSQLTTSYPTALSREGPQLSTIVQNKMDLQHTLRLSTISCRAHK